MPDDRPNRVALDTSRVENAKRKAREALRVAAYHDRRAEAERQRAESIARTWQFDLSELSPL